MTDEERLAREAREQAITDELEQRLREDQDEPHEGDREIWVWRYVSDPTEEHTTTVDVTTDPSLTAGAGDTPRGSLTRVTGIVPADGQEVMVVTPEHRHGKVLVTHRPDGSYRWEAS